jgi:hypothetical protein
MQWLDRARSTVRGTYGISLPDPDRIDIGAVPKTVALLEAIDAAMPRTALVELIGLRHDPLAAFLAACPDAIQHRADGYLLSVAHGTVAALARVARDCATDNVCAHLFVHDGGHTLLEAFGRDRGEDVVWLSRRLPKAIRRRFLDASVTDGRPEPLHGRCSMVRMALRALAVLAALGLPALTLLACVQRPALVIETSSGDVVPLMAWTATLAATSANIRGTATLSPGITFRETRATIVVASATPLAVHAWYVQLGECGHNRGILVGPQAYAPIVVDGQGDGTASVMLPFTVPTSGHYFVTVRQSDSEASPVIACGNLTKDRTMGGPTIAQARAP